MATPDFIAQLPIEPTTLPAKEYLEFLRMLEHGLPRDTRAYLVTINGDGERRLQPVGEGHSVVNLHTSLVDHLNDGFFSGDFYKELLEHCRARVPELFSQDSERTHIAIDASCELEGLADVGLSNFSNNPDQLAVRGLFARIRSLSQSIMSALGDSLHPIDEIHRDVYGVPRKDGLVEPEGA
jgi:hypothetical protein